MNNLYLRSVLFVLLFITAAAPTIAMIKYKMELEEQLEQFFSSCVKIDNNTIQCPIPKVK